MIVNERKCFISWSNVWCGVKGFGCAECMCVYERTSYGDYVSEHYTPFIIDLQYIHIYLCGYIRYVYVLVCWMTIHTYFHTRTRTLRSVD